MAGRKYYILITGFILFISFPAINNIFKFLPDTEATENRKITGFSGFDTCKIENISKTLEAFLIDNTSVRNRMIKLYNKLNVFVFKSSPVSIKAIVGKNGWYFMAGEEIKTYNGTGLFTDAELIEFKNEMLRRKKIIEKNNARFLVAIVPNKSSIYAEYMPDHIMKASHEGYGRQVLHYLQKNNVDAIDLYEPLINAKKEFDLYYQTDNHWNNLGAFVAGNAILKEMKKINPHVKTLGLDIYNPEVVIEKAGNIAKMFSLENERKERNIIPTRKGGFVSTEKKLNKYKSIKGFAYPDEYECTRTTADDSLPDVLMIRDSFGAKPFPYISEQCKKCVCIYDAWHYGLNEDIIKGEKPQIVLLLIVESNLRNVMKYQKEEIN